MVQAEGNAPRGRGSASSWTAYIVIPLWLLLAAVEVAEHQWPLLRDRLHPSSPRGDINGADLGGPGMPELTPSGRELLRRCEERVRWMRGKGIHQGIEDGTFREGRGRVAEEAPGGGDGAEAGAGESMRGSNIGESEARTWVRWNVSGLPSSLVHSDLGWVETLGTGTQRAQVGNRTCVIVAVMTREGRLFDRGCLQRVAFMANMSSREPEEGLTGRMDKTIRLSPEVTYMPHVSMHNVCYAAPQPGVYRLHIAIIFTNAFQLMSAKDPALSDGYANYTLAVNSRVHVTGPKGFSLSEARSRLPPCTLQILAGSQSKAEGFWVGDEWRPAACQVRQLEPAEMVKCLDRRSVLFLGGSEMRYTYGVLQVFTGSRSREDFLQWKESHPWHSGSQLEAIGVPRKSISGDRSPTSGAALMVSKHYSLPTGDSTFFGARFEGFGLQHVRYTASPRGVASGDLRYVTHVNGTVVYVSFFNPSRPLFTKWMLDGSRTGDVTARPGPFDLVLESTQLHSVGIYESSLEYGSALKLSYIPKLKAICPQSRCTHVSFGPWVGNERAKPAAYMSTSNNVRQMAFEEEAYRVFWEEGLPNVLPLWSLTAPQRGGRHALDSVHYGAPVTLAMIDLVFGSWCQNATGRLV